MAAAITGLPALSPGAIAANLVAKSPRPFSLLRQTQSLMTGIKLRDRPDRVGIRCPLSFVMTAAMPSTALIEFFLVVGGGVLLLGFGANRFTAPAAEGYFGYVLRVGVRLLFFYLVLAIGVQMANQWAAALLAACKPIPTTVPWWTTYGLPPSAILHNGLLKESTQ